MLLSPRLALIGWFQMRAASKAAAASDDKGAEAHAGHAFGVVLELARSKAKQRGYDSAAKPPRWVVPMLEVVSGGLHAFAERARAYARCGGRAEVATDFWQASVRAARGDEEWTPLSRLSEAQKTAGAQLAAMPWRLHTTPTARAAHDGAPAQQAAEPAASAPDAQANAEFDRQRAEAIQRAEASRRRAERRAKLNRRDRAIRREIETARARVLQIAQRIEAKQWRRRYPETLLVELTPLLMELLYRQLEVQPASDHCWGSAGAPVDAVPLVALAGDLAGRAEELHNTGHVGRVTAARAASGQRRLSSRCCRRYESPRRCCCRRRGRRWRCCREGRWRTTALACGASTAGRPAARNRAGGLTLTRC